MASKDTRYIKAILTYIDEIDGLIRGRNINDVIYQYSVDMDAILMKVMQIGEIVSRISYGTIDDYSAVVDWYSLKELRNIIGYQYDKLDINVIANIISKDFSKLKQQLTFILLTEQAKDK